MSKDILQGSYIEDFAFGVLPVACIDNAEYRYLLIQHHQGHWGFPKGHKEGDESDLAAAQREFEEETGVRDYTVFSQIRFTEQYRFRKKKKQPVSKTVTYFLGLVALSDHGQLAPVHIQAKEISAYRWCSAGEAEKLIDFEASLQVLLQCQQTLAKMDKDGTGICHRDDPANAI